MALSESQKEAITPLLPPGSILFPDDPDGDGVSWIHYGTDFTGISPRLSALCFPENTEEVAALIRFAYANGVPVVPSGGRTGYSGGAVARNGEIVISTARMDRIFGYDPIAQLIHLQAGTITKNAQDFARSHGRFFPVNFASSGSSTIGGNIATNAGGIHAVRYGTMREWTAGLVWVTGTGEIMRTKSALRKDNSGYDLREILIGSEGTLGFITEAHLGLTDPPGETAIFLFSCDDFSSISAAVERLASSGIGVQAIEFFDRISQTIVSQADSSDPFFGRGNYFILVEYETADPSSEFDFFGELADQCKMIDSLFADAESRKREIWRRRERISESLLIDHSVWKADIAIPLSGMGSFLNEVDRLLNHEAPELMRTAFGHAGDGNVHLNLLRPRESERFFRIPGELEHGIYTLVSQFGGTVSAEHGIGLVKTHLLTYCRTPEEIRIMRGIKRAFDPRSIMNPGKIFAD